MANLVPYDLILRNLNYLCHDWRGNPVTKTPALKAQGAKLYTLKPHKAGFTGSYLCRWSRHRALLSSLNKHLSQSYSTRFFKEPYFKKKKIWWKVCVRETPNSGLWHTHTFMHTFICIYVHSCKYTHTPHTNTHIYTKIFVSYLKNHQDNYEI